MTRAAASPRPAGRRGLFAAASLLGALSLTTSGLDPLAADPWPSILFGWFVASAVAAWAFGSVPVRVASIHLAAVFLVLAGFERWLFLATGGLPAWGPEEERTTSGFFIRPDALLGYAPARGATTLSTRRRDGRVFYDVASTIGPDGFRVTPPPAVDPPEASLLVLGCSFAFGEGLNDPETLPWRLAEAAGRRVLARNLAFNGYGPHQALALLESGRALSGLPAGRPVAVLYEALADHVLRALGRRPWLRSSPRYVIGPSGEVVRDGAWGELDPVMERWITWRRVLGSERRVTDGDLARVVAIVARSRDLVRRSAPGARFEVVFWDEEDDLSRRYREALAAAGFRVHDVSRALPGYPADRRGWQIPGDGHPTAAANERLARLLAEELLRLPGPPVSAPRGARAPPPLPPSSRSPRPIGS